MQAKIIPNVLCNNIVQCFDLASKWNIIVEVATTTTTVVATNCASTHIILFRIWYYSSTPVTLFSIWILRIFSITSWTYDNKDINPNWLNAFLLKESFILLKQWNQYGLLHFILHHLYRGNCNKPKPKIIFFCNLVDGLYYIKMYTIYKIMLLLACF